MSASSLKGIHERNQTGHVDYVGDLTDQELLDYASIIGNRIDKTLQSIAASLFLIARHISAEFGSIPSVYDPSNSPAESSGEPPI